MSKRYQRGFTLAELTITVLVIGIVGAVIGTLFTSLNSVSQSHYFNDQGRQNALIARAMVAFDRETGNGLPAPYTGGGFNNSVLNPGDVALATALADAGVNGAMINDDGFASQRVRVYQRLTDLTTQTSLTGFDSASPPVTVTYDFGVIYQTACRLEDANCNPAASGVPGDSPLLTVANRDTWEPVGDDFGGVRFSTLSTERERLEVTYERLNRVRDKLQIIYDAIALSSDPSSIDNFFPAPNGAGAPNLSGNAPGGNQGCYDGWYDLSAGNVNVLAQIGLAPAEYGVTASGGRIEYCRDYDPAIGGEGALPHSAAIRIHESVSEGIAPGAPGDNVVLTF
ncbi:prepilin-type N-terminal cleavage/methylation domain-containing protein [Salinisphaera sp. P385]|uniref:Prepilin-type N-terminal cleavage/methylation domain-containing protein n=1 Tax=Spectribacter acetivorans TaxID=3075603 RepID=A0ABU3B9Z5_9GAMM|nr:prepilin-type N-terminal cleavage/methylation domain-containing protein [Salinisphaera sp. P385]MDT0618647.1 prepilin-type N-terminal cleavage/methylation domain-containing protein [Salinisphaera sp. P385]